ncbi:DUF1837 domain-containing protein [Nitratireductor rhodophyticola]|uniref:HamA C-terminal domain-containing protein n=1 Tax=Nitratireductor rhodophyticola TaxID=2854036 RepID=UPI002AC8C22F|nr:DUF1837 domain-containing protein [Nitratireductor rhodophyticola]WPZ14613.1 DUF1837 domain-containing protein [Nitratireductor rhodophyticola]
MTKQTNIDESTLDISSLLSGTIRTGGKVTDVHLKELGVAAEIEDTKTRVHCYRLPIDANGRVRYKPLAEFLRERIVDYAIPRKRIDDAKRHLNETGSTALLSKLEKEAKVLFTSLSQSGEGGELLVFAFAEAVFGLTQVICKMSLKTSTEMHYHGADGVYAKGTDEAGLNIYWGESKLYENPSDAVRDCLGSLAPFLIDPDGSDSARSQDVFLINEFASFDDPKITEGLKRYFDLDDKNSLSLKHCGIALIGFDSASYLDDGMNTDEAKLEAELEKQIPAWIKQIKNRVGKENIGTYEINFICVTMRTVKEFRTYFLSLLES